MRDDNLNAFIGFRYAPKYHVVTKQVVCVTPTFQIFERSGFRYFRNSVFTRKDGPAETIQTCDFPNLAIHFPNIVLGTAEMRFSFPQGRAQDQPAFFRPPDDCVALGECGLSAYSKRFLSSCARISADEQDG